MFTFAHIALLTERVLKTPCRAINMLLLRSNAGCDSVITAGEGADDQ